jgi:transposase-like protein
VEYRDYSDEDKATALAALKANGDNVERTARDCGIPPSTLRRWRAEPDRAAPAKLREEKRGTLSEALGALAWQLIGAIPKKIADASLQHTTVSLGIVIDKMQLLEGKPTSITDDASLSDEQRALGVLALLEQARIGVARQAAEERQSATTDSPSGGSVAQAATPPSGGEA